MRHRYPYFSAPIFRHQRPVRILAVYLLLSAAGGKDKDMEFNREDFGRRVKQARMDKHLTQPQLADLLGIEWQQISRIERGFSGCSNELLVPLSEELDVSTDYLLKGVESDSELLRRQISLLMDQLSIFKSQIK